MDFISSFYLLRTRDAGELFKSSGNEASKSYLNKTQHSWPLESK